jgi:hypothetical protein
MALRLRLLVHGTVPLTGMAEATVANWRGRLSLQRHRKGHPMGIVNAPRIGIGNTYSRSQTAARQARRDLLR